MNRSEFNKRNSEIKQLALQKFTLEQIAEKMNMTKGRVMQILKSYQIKAYRPSKCMQSELAQKIIAELEMGTKQNEIAKKFKVSRQYVSQIKLRLQNTKESLALLQS